MTQPIIIASLGRCGTTFIFNAIKKALKQEESIQDSYIVDVEEYDLLEKNKVYATHDFAPKNIIEPQPKVLFLFGDIRNIVISTYNFKGQQHFWHMGSSYSKKDLLYTHDELKLEERFDSWNFPHSFPLMSVRYENIFKNKKEIEEFLNIRIPWPEKIKRKTNWQLHKKGETINRTYQNLITKTVNLPDIKKWDIV